MTILRLKRGLRGETSDVCGKVELRLEQWDGFVENRLIAHAKKVGQSNESKD